MAGRSSNRRSRNSVLMATIIVPRKESYIAMAGKAMISVAVSMIFVGSVMIILANNAPGHFDGADPAAAAVDPGLYEVCIHSTAIHLAIKQESFKVAGAMLLGMSVPMLIAAVLMASCCNRISSRAAKKKQTSYRSLRPDGQDGMEADSQDICCIHQQAGQTHDETPQEA